MSEHDQYCASCGTKVSNQSQPTTQENQATQNSAVANHVPTPPSTNVVVEQASYGALNVQDNVLQVNGNVYVSTYRRKKMNHSFENAEVTVSTGKIRGIWPRKGMVISIAAVLFILLFITFNMNTSQLAVPDDDYPAAYSTSSSPVLLIMIIATLIISIPIIGLLTIRKTNGIWIRSEHTSFFVPLYHYHKPAQHRLLSAFIHNGMPVDGLQRTDQLSLESLKSSNQSRRITIASASLISGFILLGYAIGYLLPWFQDITGVDVVKGLGKASAYAKDISGMLGIGSDFVESLSNLYYMTIATIVISVIAGVVALGMRSKGSIIFVLLASLFDLYFLFDIARKIDHISEFIPNFSSSSHNIEPGPGIVLIIVAVILSTIISFISLFAPNPKKV